MVHTLSETVAQNDEKEVKRIKSLEYRVSELENNLLRASTAALEKRVQELERDLQVSNEECQRLRDTISQMEGSASCAGKTKATENESPVQSSENCNQKSAEVETANTNNEKSNKDMITKDLRESDVTSKNKDGESNDTESKGKAMPPDISDVQDEEDSAYERILKMIEKMQNECIRSINFKIRTGSRLPKNPFMKRQDSKPNLKQGSQSPVTPTSPASPVSVTTKLSLRPRTPSSASLQSRPGTPSSIPSTPTSGLPVSGIPNGSPTGIPSKTMTHPGRSQSMSSLSRPSTPVWASSPLSTHHDIVDEPQQLNHSTKTIPIQVRTGIPVFGSGNSRPTTPVQTPSSPPSYHPNLSISPPPLQHFELNLSKSTSIPQLRNRASSYTINSGISRPVTPTRHVHLAQVQN